MRLRIYVDGRPDWTTNVPSEPLPARGWFGGALVVAPSKPVRSSWTQFGDKSLEGVTRNPQNQGVEATIPEVPAVSVTR